MVKEVNIDELRVEKEKILEKMRLLDKKQSIDDLLTLKKEYLKIHYRIRYNTDENYKKKLKDNTKTQYNLKVKKS